MQRIFLYILLTFTTVVAALAQDEYLFVFQKGETSSVYDPLTLELLAQPALGPDAMEAVGVPDPDDPTRFSKIYAVRSDSVLVLDPAPPFAVRASFPLRGPVLVFENAVRLSPDGTRLIVLGGEFAHVFDTASDTKPPTAIKLSGLPVGVTVLSNSARAYVAVWQSSDITILSLKSDPPSRLGGPIQLPEEPTALAVSPNVQALYAAATSRFYEIDFVTNKVRHTFSGPPSLPFGVAFDPDPTVDFSFVPNGRQVSVFDLQSGKTSRSFVVGEEIVEAVSPGGNQVYFASEQPGGIFRGFVGTGLARRLTDPRTGLPYSSAAVDMDLDDAGESLYLAFDRNDGEVVRVDAQTGEMADAVRLRRKPTFTSIIQTPGVRTSTVELYGGDGQVIFQSGQLPRPISVRALAADGLGVADRVVRFSSSTSGVSFDPTESVTDRFGVGFTRVAAPATDPFEVLATVDGQTVRFEFNKSDGGGGPSSGLSVLSGDHQLTVGGTGLPRPIVIEATASGAPAPRIDLFISPSFGALDCPSSVRTDSTGVAAFTCDSEPTAFDANVSIDVVDEFGRKLRNPISIKLVGGEDRLADTPRVLSSRPIVAEAGSTVMNAVRLFASELGSGFPIRFLGAEFEAPEGVSVEPATAATDISGVVSADVTFGCRVRSGSIQASLSSTGLPDVSIPFTIVSGGATRIIRVQGNLQTGSPGERLPLALKALIADPCGNGVPNEPVFWGVNPPNAARLENVLTQSNGLGEVSASVRLVDPVGKFTVSVTLLSGETASFLLASEGSAGQPRLIPVAGDGQQVSVGQEAPTPLVVRFEDATGFPISGQEVRFDMIEGSGSVAEPIAITDFSGRASTMVTAGSERGPLEIRASAAGLAVLFRLTVVGRPPSVNPQAFVNAASLQAGWTPGSTGTVFGTGLVEGISGTVEAQWPFPTTFKGVRVIVNGVPAPILALASNNGIDQINVQVPFEVEPLGGKFVVEIVNNGARAIFYDVDARATLPGVYEWTFLNDKIAVAQHEDGSLIDPTNPARPGEIVSMFWTGGGSVFPVVGTNQLGPTPPAATIQTPILLINGQTFGVVGSWYAPGFVSVYRVDFIVPSDFSGPFLNLQMVMGGAGSTQTKLPFQQ